MVYEFNENVEISSLLTSKALYLKFEDFEHDALKIVIPLSKFDNLLQALNFSQLLEDLF